MKRIQLIAVFAAASLYPSIAFAAEGLEGGAPSWFSLIFYIINFAIFLWIAVRFGLPMVKQFFSARAWIIRDSVERGESAFSEARKIAEAAAARRASLEQEKEQLKVDIDGETDYLLSRIMELANNTAERVKRDAELSSAAIGEAAQRRIRERLAAAAGGLARELITGGFTPADQRRLLDGFVARLGQEGRV